MGSNGSEPIARVLRTSIFNMGSPATLYQHSFCSRAGASGTELVDVIQPSAWAIAGRPSGPPRGMGIAVGCGKVAGETFEFVIPC